MLQKLKRFLTDPLIRFGYLSRLGFYNGLSDEAFILRKGKLFLGYTPDLTVPRSFNEKLNYLKLHDKNPLYVRLADKYEVKKYIAETIGPEYVVPTLMVWEDVKEIDWDALPKSFALKCTHDSGGVVLCRDKSRLDREAAVRKLMRSLKFNYYYDSREWPYKDLKPRIIAEEFLPGEEGGAPRDIKLYVFNGKVRSLLICSNRGVKGKELSFNYYDENLKPLEVSCNGAPYVWPAPTPPAQFSRMKGLAERLAKGMPQVRVDMYDIKGHIYVGELTLFDGGGFQPFEPQSFDYELGAMLEV